MSNLNSLDEIILQSKACREVTFKRNWLLQLGRKFWSRSDACLVCVKIADDQSERSEAQNAQKYEKLSVVFLCFVSPGYTVYD